MIRIGLGYDSHRLKQGHSLVLGGVDIPSDKGTVAHSDGDALIHALIDSILGAMGAGDIGRHFPDTDPQYKGIASIELLKKTVAMAHDEDYEVAWADITVIIERPKLAPHIDNMRETLVGAGVKGVSVKAKTNEGMGLIGQGEGVAAMSVATLTKSG